MVDYFKNILMGRLLKYFYESLVCMIILKLITIKKKKYITHKLNVRSGGWICVFRRKHR